METDCSPAQSLQPKFGLVGVFDILGFKEVLKSEKALPDLLNELRKIKRGYVHRARSAERHFRSTPEYLSFSDTILVAHELPGFNNGKTCLNRTAYFLNFAAWLFDWMFAQGWPLRGAVTSGEYFIDFKENLFVGKPIAEAFDLADIQEWSGCGITSEVTKSISTLAGMPLKEYKVPVKNPDQENPFTHALKWGSVWSHTSMRQNSQTLAEFVETQFTRHEKLISSDSVRLKLKNTETFLEPLFAQWGH